MKNKEYTPKVITEKSIMNVFVILASMKWRLCVSTSWPLTNEATMIHTLSHWRREKCLVCNRQCSIQCARIVQHCSSVQDILRSTGIWNMKCVASVQFSVFNICFAIACSLPFYEGQSSSFFLLDIGTSVKTCNVFQRLQLLFCQHYSTEYSVHYTEHNLHSAELLEAGSRWTGQEAQSQLRADNCCR